MGKTRLPRYSAHHLSDGFARVLVHGRQAPLKEFSPAELQFNEGKQTFLEKQACKIFMRLNGLEQIFYFSDAGLGNNYVQTFYVHNVGQTKRDISRLRGSLDFRYASLPDNRKKEFDEIFHKPYVQLDEVDFKGIFYKGLTVQTLLREIPRGKAGKLSGLLYEYAYNLIVLPAFRVLSGGPPQSPEDWVEF